MSSDLIENQFGCLLFDLSPDGQNCKQPMSSGGWASVRGLSPFRFKTFKELPRGVVWWTNLAQDVMWGSGLISQTNFKASNYLRTDMFLIMKEIGLQFKTHKVAKICQVLAEIFNKTMLLADEFFKINEFKEKDLHSTLKTKLLGNDLSISPHLDEALVRAYNDLITCKHEVIEDGVYVTMKRPRYAHAKSILETVIPISKGEWEFFGQEDLPKNEDFRYDFLMQKNRPFLAKLEINHVFFQPKINADISDLFNLGTAIGVGGKTRERNWVSQPELMILRKFADVTIVAAFLADKYEALPSNVFLPSLGELSDFSYSLGLLAESVWISLITRSSCQKIKSKTLVSPRACWLKASDRFLTLTSATILTSMGFTVASYGYGTVTVYIKKDEIKDLMHKSQYAGLMSYADVLDPML